MNEPYRRGICPGLSAPMSTGDGLLVRLMPAAPIPLDAMVGFCEAARRHGNGTIEVSARGSLQVRGLTPRSAPLFASAVAELGIATHEGVPVIVGFDLLGANSTHDGAAHLLPSPTRHANRMGHANDEHLPLEGGGRPAPAGREGVTALQHMLRRCHPTADCLRQSDPPPPGEGGQTRLARAVRGERVHPRNTQANTADVTAALRPAIAAARLALSPKISVVVDGSGPLHLDALTADVRLRATEPHQRARFSVPRFHLGLGGDGASAIWLGTVAATEVADAALGVLRIIAAHGPTARAAEILRAEGVEAFRAASAAIIEPASAPPQRMPAEMIGLHSALDGTVAVGIGLAFGHTHADALAEFVRVAAIHGAHAVWPVPDRTLLLIGVSALDAPSITAAAEQLGFVVHAGDPRRRIAACPGAPACGSGLIPARALAAALAPALESIGVTSRRNRALGTPSPQSKSAVADFDQSIGGPKPAYTRFRLGEGWSGGPGDRGTEVPHGPTPTPDPSPAEPRCSEGSATQQSDRNRQQPISVGGGEELVALLRREFAHTIRGIALHISGCPKGCAHPLPAALTVVGTPRGCGIVRHGSARAEPGHYLDPANLSDEILRLATKSEEAAHG